MKVLLPTDNSPSISLPLLHKSTSSNQKRKRIMELDNHNSIGKDDSNKNQRNGY